MNLNPPNQQREAAIVEQEQHLLGWQLKGVPGAIKFAATDLRNDASSFQVPHNRIQEAIFASYDAGRSISVATIAADLADYHALNQVEGSEYLFQMAGAAPATTSPDNVHRQMMAAIST